VRASPCQRLLAGRATRLATGVHSYLSVCHFFSFYFSSHFQTAPNYPQSTNLFCFLSVGNPKTVLKGGYVGWKGGSSSRKL
jgi:hypothetical protein